MKNIFKCLILGILWATVVQIAGAQTFLKGRLTDKKTGEALIGGTIKVMKDNQFIRGAVTDFEGKYRLAIDTGTYTIEACYTGYSSERKAGIIVYNGVKNIADMALSANANLQEVNIMQYKVPKVIPEICFLVEKKRSVQSYTDYPEVYIHRGRSYAFPIPITDYDFNLTGTPADIGNPKLEDSEQVGMKWEADD